MTATSAPGLLVVPENNTTMQIEMDVLCRDLAPFGVARVKRPARMLTVADLPEYGRTTLDSVEPFLPDHRPLVVYGCTAAGFLAGPVGNARIADALREKTGATVVSTADAMIQVLRMEGATEVAIVTPYLPAVNDGLCAYLNASGIAVEVLNSFLCTTTAELGAITEDQVREMALRTVTTSSRALFIACSQLPTLNVVPDLRETLGIPVWSSITATAWAANRALVAA